MNINTLHPAKFKILKSAGSLFRSHRNSFAHYYDVEVRCAFTSNAGKKKKEIEKGRKN